MSNHDPVSGRVTCSKCPYPRDGGECLRQQGVPGAGGSFGDYCTCDCHLAQPKTPSPEYYGILGKELDKLSDEQVSYERYAAEKTIEAIDQQVESLGYQRSNEFRKVMACDAVIAKRSKT